VQQAGWHDYSRTSPSDAWWEFYGVTPDSVWNGVQGNSISEGGNLGPQDWPVVGLPVFYEEAGLVTSVLPAVSMKDYIDGALRAMMPSIKGGFSVINDIIELKDIRSLPRSVRAVRDLADTLGLEFLDPKLWKKKSIGKLVRGPSDIYLQWKFNVWPMINDIAKAYKSLNSVDKQLKKLLADADKPIHRRYVKRITENLGAGTTVVENSGNSNNFYYAGGTRYERITQVGISQFSATIEYSYKLPSMTSQELRVAALADYFGLNLNPSIIWNAIPWSFVVDWTLGVSQWLNQFAIRNVRPIVYIRRFCAVAHAERSILTYLTPNWTSIHEGGPALCSQVTEKAFRRIANYPDLYSSITSSGVDPTEFTLAAALAGSRFRP
jgi:hypothetical protein